MLSHHKRQGHTKKDTIDEESGRWGEEGKLVESRLVLIYLTAIAIINGNDV